jgi:hypothetical protein
MADIFMKKVRFESFAELVALKKGDERFEHNITLRYHGFDICGDMEVEWGRNLKKEDKEEFSHKMVEIIHQM